MSLRSTDETTLNGEAAVSRQHELGQFFTPAKLANFMASMFAAKFREVNLLDAGAGVGSLSAAVVRRLCAQAQKPKRIAITAYELDSPLVPLLRETLSACEDQCGAAKIDFSATVHNGDFIEATVPSIRHELFAPPLPAFNLAIVNPPYRKIRSNSSTRELLSSAGIETSNIYTGFLSVIFRLLADGGELVAITPRSFCNGPYFKPFRDDLLSTMSLRRLHVFESRSKAFRDDAVLQENIIMHAVKSPEPPKHVSISTSTGDDTSAHTCRTVPFADVVAPRDKDCFIHLVTNSRDKRVRNKVAEFSISLPELGLQVSTGRVVDFRARRHLRQQPSTDTAPLIYPAHFNGGFVHWPKLNGRKPNAIYNGAETRDLLVPAGIYVLVKRFTTKEERRRIVACIYDPARVDARLVGFENHLNYFHVNGAGMDMVLARGLAVFLNSTLVDAYFRQFNGHTQVNATDLRNLKYPTREQLVALGTAIGEPITDQKMIDETIEKELNARS